MFLQFSGIGIGDLFRVFGQFFRMLEGGFFFGREAVVVSGFQSFPVFRGEDSLRRSEMVLGSIMAAVEQADAQVDGLVQLAIERFAYARVEGGEVLQRFRTMGHRFVYVAGLAAQDLLINLFDFGRGVLRFDAADSCH